MRQVDENTYEVSGKVTEVGDGVGLRIDVDDGELRVSICRGEMRDWAKLLYQPVKLTIAVQPGDPDYT